ncbi:MAG: VWA domain-containing protein [Bdellovibrionales bacterium]|nr:VWA domain-containing protein [Bdellovibrionales bacterium]
MAIILMWGLLQGCGPQATNFSILPDGTAVYQGNVANNKVDVLWVIDNSGSMLTKQQNLATSFDSFADVFVTKNFDFNFAIVTTDTRATPVGQNGEFQGVPTVITASTPAFSNTFKTNVVVGSFGDPAAKALDAILLSLSTAHLAGANTGFLRADAHLAVVVLSDADDNDSAASVSDVVSFLDTLKPQVYDVVNRTYKRNYTANAVVVDTSNPANSACAPPFEDGVKFKQLAAATEGSITSICEADFSTGLTNISKSIAQAITQIPLRRTPLVETIVVKFNGAPVAQNSSNGWSYVSSGNKIVFNGTAIPDNGTTINVDYIPADIIR